MRVLRIPCASNRHLFTLAALPTMLGLAGQANVVHASTYNAAPAGWLAARVCRRAILLTVWESWIGRWRQRTTASPGAAMLYEGLERAIFSLPFDVYAAISQATAADLRRALPGSADRVCCVPLGFDPTAWRAPYDPVALRSELGVGDAFLIVGYGRPGVSKGFGYLVDAAARAATHIPNLTLVLVLSDAPQHRAELAALKRQAGPHVIFLPSQPLERLVRIVKAADCVVIPSVAEGFGYTTLEACASGVPVVATRTGSIPEVIGGRFVLVEPRSAEALARGILEVRAGNFASSRNVVSPGVLHLTHMKPSTSA